MDLRQFHILVVDDLVDGAESTVKLLDIWGYDAVACYDGASALESACLRQPGLVLLDLLMPGMDGFRFTGLFREVPGCELVPIIVVSGYSTPAYQARAREIGISHYLLKPADPEILMDLVAREIEATAAPIPLLAASPTSTWRAGSTAPIAVPPRTSWRGHPVLS